MNDALMNTVRLFEAFDFMSLTEARPRTHNTLSMSAFDVWRLRGTARALSRAMLEKDEKLTDRAWPTQTLPKTMKLDACWNQCCEFRSNLKEL